MRIAVDVMESDLGPAVVVNGAIEAARRNPGLFPVLVGDESVIRDTCTQADFGPDQYDLVATTEAIPMHANPVDALRKFPRASLIQAIELVRDGKAEAIVSAGSTGAQVAASTLLLKLLPGVKRAGIATLLPTRTGRVVVLDVGANPNCKPAHLAQYAMMGSLYAKHELGVDAPRVGLLSIGSERSKGNLLVKESHDLLSTQPINFIGNCEGHDVFEGVADVVVCDGFIGNVLLKISEGLAGALFDIIGEAAHKTGMIKDDTFRTTMGMVKKRVDWQEVGGAQLLGVNGISVIAHGRSSAFAVTQAVSVAYRLVETKLNTHIVNALESTVSSAS